MDVIVCVKHVPEIAKVEILTGELDEIAAKIVETLRAKGLI